MSGTTAIVLAGGGRDAVAAFDPGAPNKAFLAIGGRTLVARTIDALRSASGIGRIIAVVPDEAIGHKALAGADESRVSGTSIAQSMRAGLAGLDPQTLVLVSVSDLPILSRVAIEDFLAAAAASDCDVGYSCVERSIHEARFPQVPHTWARLREGEFCGGGLAVLRPRAFAALEKFLGRLGAARKNPLRLASIFGYDTVLTFALGRLRIAGAERRASALLGAPVRALPSAHPEIAVNVDRPSDVALAEQLVVSGL